MGSFRMILGLYELPPFIFGRKAALCFTMIEYMVKTWRN